MAKLSYKRLLFTAVLLAIHLTTLTAIGQSKIDPTKLPKCTEKTIKGLDFSPKAFTLTSVYVRAQMPEYSFLKGQWILGQFVDTLPPYTCLAIIEKKEVGVIQIWYLVKYVKDGKLRSGWIWGGTKNVDETAYIGGDTTPEPEKKGKNSSLRVPAEIHSSNLFANFAYAQTDLPPGGRISPVASAAEDERAVQYYVKIPLLGWDIRTSVLSAIVLFLVMVIGMVAKAFWDQTESGNVIPPFVKLLRPFLISPIAFSAFWTPMYIQQGSSGVSFTMALYAFQIGFMWQHVLEKKLTTDAKGIEKDN